MSSNLLQLNSNRNYPGFTQDIIDPNSTHNSTTGFNVGNIWINTVNNTSYVLVNAVTPVWQLISSFNAKLNLSSVVDPTTADDNTLGYGLSSIWINTAVNSAYIATNVATGAATWVRLSDIKTNFTAIVDPTTSDNTALGYQPGSRWINTVSNKLFTLIKVVGAVATWFSPASSIVTTSTIDPALTNDSSGNFNIGSLWINTVSKIAYISTDSTVGAAVWTPVTQAGLFSNFTALVDPSLTSDVSIGYIPGSIWINTVTGAIFMAQSTGAGAAVWTKISSIKNNFSAVVNPATTDNATTGYQVGSRWINIVTNTLFTCVDITGVVALWIASGSATIAAAFPANPTLGQIVHNTTNDTTFVWDGSAWIDISAAGGAFVKTNFTAVTDPLVGNDSSAAQGYDVGSVWVNTLTGKVFTATDVTIGAAVWTSGSGSATVAATAPTTPGNGDIWYNSTTDIVFIYNGTTWVDIVSAGAGAAAATVAASPPPAPSNGAIWYNSTTDIVFIYNGTTWIDIVSAGGGGSASATVSATAPPTPTAGDFWYNSTTDIVFIYNGTTWVDIVSAGTSAATNWQVITAAHTAISGERLALDSTGGIFTVTLPAAPATNDTIDISDIGQVMTLNNVTIARNGSTIQGLASDLIINTNNTSFELTFLAASWRIV